MKLHNFLDLIISGAFALGAFLWYLMVKDNVKTRRERGDDEFGTKANIFKSWIMIFMLVMFCLAYFFSFIGSLSF
jgi:magnesium-transporting ATPase (P-type)